MPASSFELIAPAADLAQRIARTEFVPAALRNRPEAVLAAILYGHEAGIGPMESLAKINVIEGRPAFSAELMRAQVLRHGHRLWAEEVTTARVMMCGQRRDDDHVHRVTWTMDDARKAGIAGKPTWQRYPRAMLEARATAELCRLAFPDVLGAVRYAVEELEDSDSIDSLPALPETPATSSRRRRRPPAPVVVDVPADTSVLAPTAMAARPPLPDEPLSDRYDDAPMSEPQRRKLNAALRDVGITSRPDKLALCSGLVGRRVDSSNDLTGAETSTVIDALDGVARGEADLVLDADGAPVGLGPRDKPA
jgi:hypothetical protein